MAGAETLQDKRSANHSVRNAGFCPHRSQERDFSWGVNAPRKYRSCLQERAFRTACTLEPEFGGLAHCVVARWLGPGPLEAMHGFVDEGLSKETSSQDGSSAHRESEPPD